MDTIIIIIQFSLWCHKVQCFCGYHTIGDMQLKLYVHALFMHVSPVHLQTSIPTCIYLHLSGEVTTTWVAKQVKLRSVSRQSGEISHQPLLTRAKYEDWEKKGNHLWASKLKLVCDSVKWTHVLVWRLKCCHFSVYKAYYHAYVPGVMLTSIRNCKES